MREPMQTAQSLGDDTQAVVARPKRAREHGLHTECGPVVSMGCEPGPSMGTWTRTWAKMNVRPQSLVWKQTGRKQKQRQRRRQNNTRQEVQHRTRQDKTGQDKTRQDRTGLRNICVRTSSLPSLPQMFTFVFQTSVTDMQSVLSVAVQKRQSPSSSNGADRRAAAAAEAHRIRLKWRHRSSTCVERTRQPQWEAEVAERLRLDHTSAEHVESLRVPGLGDKWATFPRY